MGKKSNKHSKKTNPYCVMMYPKYSFGYNLYKRYILLSGECTTRKATQEELDKYKNDLKL
jgi:hypothetical protein